MSRIASVTLALGCALAMTVHAQDTKIETKTKTKGGDAQMISYTGCVQTGTETRTYVLEQAVPVSRSTTTQTADAAGSATTTTTSTAYELVPTATVELEKEVGHKVEVTGMLIPGGDSKSKTKTKIEHEDAPDTTIKQKTKSDDALPQFRVVSVRALGESCTP
jgi:hypothetical protein